MTRSLPHRPRIFRDPIHGDITYPRGPFQLLVERVVDTEMFQRLRGIRQTSEMNTVFHGAEHSRFSHSMGAAHVAGLMFDAAVRNSGVEVSPEERGDTVLAALLHDVGHGPFSHSLEEIIGGGFRHERMTLRILDEPGSQIRQVLGEADPALPARLRAYVDHGNAMPRWHHAIVSSQLDADRLDYLARDAHMAGVHTHQIDVARLVQSLGVIDEYLVVDQRAHDIIETFLLALDQMYEMAYYHKTVRAASLLLQAIIQRAVDLAHQDPVRWRPRLFPERGDEADPFWTLLTLGDRVPLPVYENLSEAHVWSLMSGWRRAGDALLAELVAAWRQRRFPKPLRIEVADTPAALGRWQELIELARRAWLRLHPEAEPSSARYHVFFDEPRRLSYKRYTAGHDGSQTSFAFASPSGEPPAGPVRATNDRAESIKITTHDGGWQAIEDDPRSIANNLSQKRYFPRLFLPADVRAALEATPGLGAGWA